MPYKVTYRASEGRDPETVDANQHLEQGDWLVFTRRDGGFVRDVARIRADQVERVEYETEPGDEGGADIFVG